MNIEEIKQQYKGHTYTFYAGKIPKKGYALSFLRNFNWSLNFREGIIGVD